VSKPLKKKVKHWKRVTFFWLLRRVILPPVVVLFRYLWANTWRITIKQGEGCENALKSGHGGVLTEFHGDFLATVAFGLGLIEQKIERRIVSMVSPSRDGQLLKYLIESWGQETIEGSSAKGGARALIGLRKVIKAGDLANIAIDGPRGPRGVPNGGAVTLARSSKTKLYIMAARQEPCWRAPSWDRACVPLPFARIEINIELFHDYEKDPPMENELQEFQRRFIDLHRRLDHPVDDISPVEAS